MSEPKTAVAVAILAKHYNASTVRAIDSARRFGLDVSLGLTHDPPSACERDDADVFPIVWRNDFADARNQLLERVGNPFVLWIDSDEELFAFPRLDWSRLPEDFFYVRTQFNREFTPRVHVRMHRNCDGIRWRDRIHERLANVGDRPYSARFISGLIIRHFGYEDSGTVLAKHARNLEIADVGLGTGSPTYAERLTRARAEAALGRPNMMLWLECFDAALAANDPVVQPSFVGFEPAFMLCIGGYSRPARRLLEIEPLNLFLQVAVLANEYRYHGCMDPERLTFVAECLQNGFCNVYENFPCELLGADRNRIVGYIDDWTRGWTNAMDSATEVGLTCRYRQNDAAMAQPFDGDILLMDPIERKVVVLNAASSVMWDLLASPQSVDDLVSVLKAGMPDADPHVQRSALLALLHELLAASLIIES